MSSPLTLAELEAKLRLGMAHLPGADAQALMAPRPRRDDGVPDVGSRAGVPWKVEEHADRIRTAAALVLLYPRDGKPHIVLTVRSGGLSHHSGQVSFPGGAVEPGEAIASAALREAGEEVGIDPSIVRIVGALTPLHIPVSDFIVHPIVGVAESAPQFNHAADEVARVMEVPFEALLDRSRLHAMTRRRGELLVEARYFEIDGEQVWGATAMMLAELICIVGERRVFEGD